MSFHCHRTPMGRDRCWLIPLLVRCRLRTQHSILGPLEPRHKPVLSHCAAWTGVLHHCVQWSVTMTLVIQGSFWSSLSAFQSHSYFSSYLGKHFRKCGLLSEHHDHGVNSHGWPSSLCEPLCLLEDVTTLTGVLTQHEQSKH